MGYHTVSVAAATAVVGYDLLQQTQFQQSAAHRAITGWALTGSAVVGDTKVSLYIDDKKVAEAFNSKLLVPNKDDMLGLAALFVPAGCLLHCYVDDAPATNPIYVALELTDVR